MAKKDKTTNENKNPSTPEENQGKTTPGKASAKAPKSGNVKGPKGVGEPGTKGKPAKEKASEKAPKSGNVKGPKGVGEPEAKGKTPSELNQPGKEKSAKKATSGKKAAAKKQPTTPIPKAKEIPEKTSALEKDLKQVEEQSAVKKTAKTKKTAGTTKAKTSATSKAKKTATSKTTKEATEEPPKLPKPNQEIPEKTTASEKEVKEQTKKKPAKPKKAAAKSSKEPKEQKTTGKETIGETSTVDDLKNIAKTTAKDLADKYLPDEETQRGLKDIAKSIVPDKEDLEKSAKRISKDLSPEKEALKDIADKFVPDEIKERAQKVKENVDKFTEEQKEKSTSKMPPATSLISDYDIHLFKEGKHYHMYKKFGSHLMDSDGKQGVYFALWAPNARMVSVIGDFNDWSKQKNQMEPRPDESGIWEIFIPEAKKGSLYKYFIQSTTGYEVEKGDPFAFMWETPPNTASVVWDLKSEWDDKNWMESRKEKAGKPHPMSVYEIHMGSWKRVPEDNLRSLSYREMAEDLPGYLKDLGFTHVEFMPVMEHPFFGSWGYQITGYFAPSSRFGTPEDFMHLIDALHQAGIGVILDWVPSHFPSDMHGLHYFDGTFLYEHEDPRKGFHPDWKSYIFNFGRNEIRSFLISNALFWLDKFHIDGLRVDAVASMLYLDYSREAGEWEPNEFGGNENLDAISFLKEFNETVYKEYPDTITIAEESTAWPMVSRPTYMGGLGFGMKWMMGWMHDTLEYFQNDPIHRKHHQNTITFSTNYAFTENFMLPLSHDEVVYGKGPLIDKMPGDTWNKFANLRSLYAYMYSHPGAKLLFMGAEFAQTSEWDHDSSLDWHLLDQPYHKQIQNTIKALNTLYQTEPALYEKSFEPEGFEWIDFHDAESSVISYIRKTKDPKDTILVVCNFTPVPRENYRIGVPEGGKWKEIFNSDEEHFGGSKTVMNEPYDAVPLAAHGKIHSVALKLPPMGVIYLKQE